VRRFALVVGGYARRGEYREEVGAAMSAESRRPEAPDHADVSRDLSASEVSARHTPDESTVGLVSAAESPPASDGDADFPRLRAGESLARRFTILRFIAQGGMGAVYEANDVMLRSRVALKVIRGRIATDATAMERFRREVLLARRVGHPNVCRVYELYDATTAAGVPIHFLTMELLEGETLARRIARQGRLTTAEALPLVRQMCEGLAAAHAEGVIHRDFKSSNVMLVSRGEGSDLTRVAITDFGIARAAQAGSMGTRDSPLTGDAVLVGTPAYMAPEQVTGGAVTQATDIYALGVVLYEMVTGKLPFTGETPLAAASKRLNEAPPRPEVTAPELDSRWSAALLRCLALEPERRFKSTLDILPALERRPRRWPRRAVVTAAVLALVLVAFAAVKTLPHLRTTEPARTAVPAAPRPVLAILGFRNELASPGLAWLPTAVSESLGHELAAAEMSLRVIPGDRVARARHSLGVSEDAVGDPKVRERMQGLLAANVLVYGTLKPMAQNSASLVLSIKMVDAASGRELASLEEDLGEGGAVVAEKVSGAAARLRELLGVALSEEQSTALSASRSRNLAATQSYSQGVRSLRKFEYANARSYFEAALAMDSSFLDAQRRVVETWEAEGNSKKAREATERIRSRRNGLTPRQAAIVEAKLLSLGPEPSKGAEARKAIFDATPDDMELGLGLVELLDAPRTAGAIISRLRELPAPASRDIRLDIAEADVAWHLGNPQRAEEFFARAHGNAQALGARTEMADALSERAKMLLSTEGSAADAWGPLQEAAGLLDEVGELDRIAALKSLRADLVLSSSSTGTALKVLEENAALYRRLGDRARLSDVLISSASQLYYSGEIELAKRKLREALLESEAIGEAPGSWYTFVDGAFALAQADLERVRNAVGLLRTEPNQNEMGALWEEVEAFKAQDRLQEARETAETVKTLLETNGRPLEASYFQRELCELACDEGRPLAGLDCLAQHPVPPGLRSTWTLGTNRILAKCRYLSGDLQGAERAALDTRADGLSWGWYDLRVLGDAYLMRVRAARGESGRAIASLRADVAEAEGKHFKSLAFESALALGEVELLAKRPEGRTRLLKLEQEAKSKEFFRIARLAREALDGKSAAAASKPGR
jgi:eukaryotic-like serine/threonine-protein kinase